MPEIRPFDPSKIDIDMKTMELSSIIKRMKYEEINMNTSFQRKSGLWTKVQKSQLIESLLLRIPIPAFYFDGGIKDNWLIIDGLQRITALKEFVVDGTLELTGLELKPQEIRHALYQGRATELCKRFAKFPEFQVATTYSISSDRMMDQEFVLRFVAVCYYGVDKYEGIPDNYLNGAMEYMNSKSCADESEIEEQFKKVMVASKKIMGKYAFRKLGENGIRRPINKAIYEAWCRGLFCLRNSELDVLIQHGNKVYSYFLKLCNNSGFLQVIKSSDKKSFLMRFMYISDMLKEVLNDTEN